MLASRLIPVLLLDKGEVVQTRRFKIVSRLHTDPIVAARAFDAWSADEVIVLDITRRPPLPSVADLGFDEQLQRIADEFTVPLTAGGRIGSPQEVTRLMRMGADKVVVNTATQDSRAIKEMVDHHGSQAVVASIDFSVKTLKVWHTPYMVESNKDVFEHIWDCLGMGVGEILLNTIENDGGVDGYPLDVFQKLADAVDVPVVFMGGVKTWQHLVDGINHGASGVAFANQSHYVEGSVWKAKKYMEEQGVHVRS